MLLYYDFKKNFNFNYIIILIYYQVNGLQIVDLLFLPLQENFKVG